MTTRALAYVLLRPVVTEKSTRLQEEGKYVFEVQRQATKGLIKQAVEVHLNVKVKDVNTMVIREKTKRYGARLVYGRLWKKAIVTLQPGNKITLFESI